MNQALLRIKSQFSDILIFHCQNVKSEIDYFFASFHPSRTMKFLGGKQKSNFFCSFIFYNKILMIKGILPGQLLIGIIRHYIRNLIQVSQKNSFYELRPVDK